MAINDVVPQKAARRNAIANFNCKPKNANVDEEGHDLRHVTYIAVSYTHLTLPTILRV